MTNIPTIKETRRVLYNLQRRLARIEKVGGGKLSTFALDRYKDYLASGRITNDIRQLTPQERKAMYNDIVELSNLGTSTVKGAMNYKRTWEEVGDIYDTFDEEERKTFKEMTGKVVELIGQNFKYDVQRIIAEQVDKGKLSTAESKKQLLENVTDIYRKAELERGGRGNDSKFQLRVTEDIEKFLRELD